MGPAYSFLPTLAKKPKTHLQTGSQTLPKPVHNPFTNRFAPKNPKKFSRSLPLARGIKPTFGFAGGRGSTFTSSHETRRSEVFSFSLCNGLKTISSTSLGHLASGLRTCLFAELPFFHACFSLKSNLMESLLTKIHLILQICIDSRRTKRQKSKNLRQN